MKWIFSLFCATMAALAIAPAQDTFSIVAADSSTREVGSAGASCVDLFSTSFTDDFLGDLLPDTGAINTQASYLAANQRNARTRMRAGDTPSQIITFLSTTDAAGNPNIRQYGVAGFTGGITSSAGYTGSGCLDYKNHITGSINGIYYSIQGNILSGQSVLDSMEARFRRADGDLACRLMAALQGANTVGADTRCASNGTSSLFAFVKVAQPTDAYGSPSFLVSVRTHNGAGIEPIDSLQIKFDAVHGCGPLAVDPVLEPEIGIFPRPASDWIMVNTGQTVPLAGMVTEMTGRQLLVMDLTSGSTRVDVSGLPAGLYILRLSDGRTTSLCISR